MIFKKIKIIRIVRILSFPLLAYSIFAFSQVFPSKPSRIIVAFPPGGAADIVARIYAAKLTEMWGQTVLIDNRPGASGNIGTEIAARAPADGYNMFQGSLGNLAVNPSLFRSLPFDVLRDFSPVTKFIDIHFVMVCHTSLPVQNVKELIILARAHPGDIAYASSGSGGAPHLAGELFRSLAKVDLLHIPYKGSGPSFADLLGGHVSLTIDSIVQSLPYIKNKRLRALGVGSSVRSQLLPEVPTIAEAGLPGFEITNWLGLLVPSLTSKELINRIHSDFLKISKNLEIRQRIIGMGADPMAQTPEEFSALIRSETKKWAKIIIQAGIKPD